MMPAMSYVIRDCEEQEIRAEEVVVGDLVYLRFVVNGPEH